MNLATLHLVTIIAERLLEEDLVALLRELGARGYTTAEVRGEGSRGVRASEWEGASVRIETLVPGDVAERIMETVAARYFQHYAVIAYDQEVRVVRSDKFR